MCFVSKDMKQKRQLTQDASQVQSLAFLNVSYQMVANKTIITIRVKIIFTILDEITFTNFGENYPIHYGEYYLIPNNYALFSLL